MLRIVHILPFLLLSAATFAQRMPVSVTTILTPPYSSSLSAMSESGSTRLMVNLLVNDVTVSELPVKLHIKMESAGITIESLPTQAVAPMLLGGGEVRVLTGDDFAQYLRMDNLNFKGFSKSSYQKTGRLPSGLWRISVSVRHFYTDKTISNVGTATAWITTYKPPVLTAPKEGETAPSNAALPLTFSWQPSKLTGGAATVMYRFEMWERRVDGVPAQAVVASVPPIYTTETAGLMATVIPASLALEPGMKYCWRVTAFDPAGRATFEDGGRSEVRTFQYLEKCPEVSGLTVDLKDVTGYARWDADTRHSGGYNVEVYDDEGTYHETRWGYDNKTCGIGGDHGKTWHVRVQGICNSQVVSGWSGWADFTTPERFKPQTDAGGRAYECGGLPPPREIANRALAGSLQKGDIVEDERGTTKFIIHSATRNDDGSFRGLSYMRLSIWGVKVLGEYDKMMVNTDGVIIGGYAWRSVKSGALLANPEAIEQWADETALNIAGATYNNTIKDTIRLGGVRFETISREGGKYFALTSDGTKEEITSAISGKSRALVQDSEGHELVIDKDGEPMGVAEYRACGGSKILMDENNAHRDSTMAAKGNVTFSKPENETYGFDCWRGEDYDKEQYPNLNGYRPAYICVEKDNEVNICVSRTNGVTFKTERGVPLIAVGNTIKYNADATGDHTIYAYSDTVLVGKLCVKSFDIKEVKVHLVRVNDDKHLDVNAIAAQVNEIYGQAAIRYTFDELDPIKIEYANKKSFVHGGKGSFQNYNADQKAAIKVLPQGADQNDYYLFFVECYDRLDTSGYKSKQAVGGYMPVGRHYGFIYNEYVNARTIAHELGHGTNALHHTFAEGSESFVTTTVTDNLMDYHGGTRLNHRQWQWAHEKHRNVLGFMDDEGESEAISNDIIDRVRRFCLKLEYEDGSETIFEDSLINECLLIDNDRFRYRKYIKEIKTPISFLTSENVTLTQSGVSSGYNYTTQHITIASKGVKLNDMSISLFHEYLHRVNDVIGIYRYNNSVRLSNIEHTSFIVSVPYEKFDACVSENSVLATHLYNQFLSSIMTDRTIDINNYITYDNISELPTDLYDILKKYCNDNNLLNVEVRIDESVYEPTNYVRDELSVYHWCLEYGEFLGGFSENKRKNYYDFIKRYFKLFEKYKRYESEHNLNEEGYEK